MTDQTVHFQIELRSPLLMGTDREYALFVETREYVPGSVLRGSLARLLQEQQAAQDFSVLFGPESPDLIVENLYPSWSESVSWPVPLSARTCKHHPGFKVDGEAHHGVGDILIRQSVFEEVLRVAPARLPMLYTPRCPSCQAEVAPPDARFYEGPTSQYRPVKVPVRRVSRTAIDRRRRTAADQLLYTLETIEPGKQAGLNRPQLFFVGQIHCRADQADVLNRWLPGIQWLGQGRSRGLGQISLKLSRDTAHPAALIERLTKFDDAVRKEWPFYQRVAGVTPPAADVHFFSLDLLSPAIFTRHGLPTLAPDLSDLQLAEQATIGRTFADSDVIGGWQMGAGRPRRTLQATAMGSVYLIKTRGLTLKDLAERLQPVETSGLGLERDRGFGRIRLSSTFHTAPEVTL